MKRLGLLVLTGLLALPGMSSAQGMELASESGAAPGAVLPTGTEQAAGATGMPSLISGIGDYLHPEGVAWDPTRDAFLITSTVRNSISVVGRDGKPQTLVTEPAMPRPLGIRVDVPRNRILAAYSQGLGIFELSTGRTLHLVTFGKAPNDLAVDWSGNAYVTDPEGDTIYKVDVNGIATPFITDARLSGGLGMNGVVWHPAGFLLVVHYTNGKLFKVTRNGITEVAMNKSLIGADGIAFQRDGSLAVVTNKISVPGEDAVTVLRPCGLWESAVVTQHTPTAITAPTTAAVTPYGTYVVHGRIDWLVNQGKPSQEFFISRI
ncbi:SMP-30/gluconolactonase/LRE family protein [Kibdelosporangium philippinense]|uniref:SMP-30/gluconolactonase/LRE family protein n=1 Tax=Kibdelosporangium philippinense TaxID=211113 RepID=A0ABS8ZE32_9PSEU|nr:SMP-30/gluconolactonase/LRE family protein [Kibdelosporangium philippinense]MCE7005807.1 SMP-30/gluconolactonase/LRE family protein [Kibdelosporangium philippinense]